MRDPTPQQLKTLRAICRFVDERNRVPSIREICELVGLSSTATISAQLASLRAKGYVTWEDGMPRTLRVLIKPLDDADVIITPTTLT